MDFMKMKRGEQDLLIRVITGLDFLYDTINNTFYTEADYTWIKSRLYPYDKSGRVKKDYNELIKQGWLRQDGDKLSVFVGGEDELQRFERPAKNVVTPTKKLATPTKTKKSDSRTPYENETCEDSQPLRDDVATPTNEKVAARTDIYNTSINTSTDYIESSTNNKSREEDIYTSTTHENESCEDSQPKKNSQPEKTLDEKIDELEANNDVMDIFDAFVEYSNEMHEKSSHIPTRAKNKKTYHSWLSEINRLITIDKKPADEAIDIINHMKHSWFNPSNFMSVTKLRRKNKDGVTYYDYFKQIMNEKGNSYGKNKNTQDDWGDPYENDYPEPGEKIGGATVY